MSIFFWQNQWLLTIYWDNAMFDIPKFVIINIWKDICMNILLNKNTRRKIKICDVFVIIF
jgi:hypothetical protein